MEVSDLDVLIRTAWGEARGEGHEGMKAVTHVILNRASDSRWPNSWAEVCTQPWQFSCWNEGDPNAEKMENLPVDDEGYLRASTAVTAAILDAKDGVDPTGKANHYFAEYIDRPSWALDMKETAHLGVHIFMVG